MAKTKIYDMQAKEVGEIDLKDELFGVEYNEAVIHQQIVAEAANARQGTQKTLSVSEIRGHSKKPYAQKHTGNARHGNTKAPQYTGGGMVHALRPRDYTQKVNKQVKALAFVSALSQKLAQNELTVIDDIKVAEPKTKLIKAMLDCFKFNRKTLIVVEENNADLLKATANLENVTLATIDLVSTRQLVSNKNVIFSKKAIEILEEARV